MWFVVKILLFTDDLAFEQIPSQNRHQPNIHDKEK